VTDIDRLVELLRLVPPAPRSWVQAAQELPLAHARLDEIVARAEADARFRQALLDDLESALAEAGVSNPRLLDVLRRRLIS
jgi:hypothetical protein